ncbi:MAG: serine hydrolase [Fuerstiella sp.]|nr:serine hydrolase [Fuerstiella sp.]MCP4782736.1 serine hydrolase [Fuerstiella sp.]MCP4855157.1 serine hydrolase [Fuerstiella sp.]
MKHYVLMILCATSSQFVTAQQQTREQSLYFPAETEWETVSPESLNLSTTALNTTLDFAMERKSSSVIILHRGRILAERHQTVPAPSRRYQGMLRGKTSLSHVIEDVASCQKSVTCVLVGIAQQKGLLKLNDSVHKHLGQGWSQATPEQEAAITLRHLITMTSGLNARLKYVAPAGTKWAYNTTAYSRSLTVVTKAAKMTANEVTKEWLTGPLGMEDSKWVDRRLPVDSTIPANRYGFATSARDLARFGLLMLANGNWRNEVILSDRDYLKAATSPSQKLNASYGYLWWLNGQKFALRGTRRAAGSLLPGAPKDLFSAQGALGRRCSISPSRQLVMVRIGDSPDKAGEPKYDQEFWRLLMKVRDREDRDSGRTGSD